ncbi:hypothetical protein THF1C08_270001 [Vibrio jasicida]|uniref:Uncharacterized protein n=1 Tax=Vibrio jasicida TaxID=766224 RepID=A0AAU9QM96_9VIBR|nr:hypothetical protein THF1C08_270001 [Vibrio jasicida]CAH1592839.1 hypothetical protein THF1A12_260001 [Vibrio jasicida]
MFPLKHEPLRCKTAAIRFDMIKNEWSKRLLLFVISINMQPVKTYCQKILFCDKFARNLGA